MQPSCTCEPEKAPAWKRSSASPAVSLPSFVAPIRTLTWALDVGPVARNTSSRSITILTGRPALRERASATGST